jgi:hypothetical protein
MLGCRAQKGRNSEVRSWTAPSRLVTGDTAESMTLHYVSSTNASLPAWMPRLGRPARSDVRPMYGC